MCRCCGSANAGDQALAEKLKSAGLNLEWRLAKGVTNGDVFEWLAGHQRDEFPAAIDCETNSPTFARCYWIRMAKFDASERNDVLPSTRLAGGSGAALDLGAFSYSATDAGPGVLVSHLPEKYSGPLKMGDRIVALDGKPIQDARQFAETMEQDGGGEGRGGAGPAGQGAHPRGNPHRSSASAIRRSPRACRRSIRRRKRKSRL